MKGIFLSVLLLAALETNASAQSAPTLNQTSYLGTLAEKLRQGMTAEQAADYANSQLAVHGFDYSFDACPLVKANPEPGLVELQHRGVWLYRYSFVRATGRRLRMDVIGSPKEGLCSECVFEIPLLRITKRQMLVVADGRQYLVRRPAGFFLKEISLVDRNRKRVLRTWEVPLDTQLAGISDDGRKIYLELLNNYGSQDLLDKIVLEVSGSTVEFRPRNEVGIREGETIPHRRDPRDAYLSFKRFRAGNKEYIIRYDAPCT